MYLKQNINLQSVLFFLIKIFLFLLPWQTIWLYREVFVGGVKMEYGTLGFYTSEILLWVIIVVFMYWYIKKSKVKSQKSKVFEFSKDRVFLFSVLCLISYVIISTFWSTDRSLALQQGVRIMEAILLFLIIFIGPFSKEKLIRWFIYGAILPSILGIWQFLTQTTFASTWLGLAAHPAWQTGTSIIANETIGRWLRAYGSFSHPNVFGGYLAVAIMLLPSSQKSKVKSQKFDFVLVSILVIALFFTFSRTAWLALLIGLGVLCCLDLFQPSPYRGGKGWGLLSAICFLILATIYFPLIQTRTNNSTISETRSITERTAGYGEAWKMIKQNPALGVGVGNYTIALWRMDKWRPVWEIQPVHNVPLLFLAELGFIGIGLFLLVIVTFFYYQIANSKYQRRCYLLSVICILPLILLDHYLYTSFVGLMLLSVFLGILFKNDTQSLPS